MTEQLRYHPLAVPANGTVDINGSQVGGFLCTVSGTLTITRKSPLGDVITAFPFVAGAWTPLPFYLGHNGATVIAAGGCAGVLGVA